MNAEPDPTRTPDPTPARPTSARPDYDWLYSRTRAGRARGPQGAAALLARLGDPQQAFRSVRVIGTNGKGSTCAMLEAGLLAAGAAAGRFTSPHLTHFEERVRVNGADLPPARTAAFIRWAQTQVPDAAFFDLTLALACQEFARAGVGVAVMEAGVGGRSDATQALTRVAATVITNVDLDHVGVLGGTVEAIAADKAGAAQAGVPLLTTATGAALTVITAAAAQAGAPLLTPDTHPDLFTLPRPPRLEGPHQHRNAALAAATLRTLGYGPGVDAALNATHPARLERLQAQGRTVLIDGAHNPHATRALVTALHSTPVQTLLFGNLARKDTGATLDPLLPLTPQRVFTAPGDLATPPHELAATHAGEAIPDMTAALNRALTLTPPGGTLLVTGSLYLAGHVRAQLLARTP